MAPSSPRPRSSGPPPEGEAFGRYRLLEAIGRGGMAEVFKAKSFGVEGFEKVLVIKRIVPELAAVPEFVKMFVEEAKLAVRLSHANIVQVFDLGRVTYGDDAAPDYFIAMEFVAGIDLASGLRELSGRGERLPVGLAVFIAAEIAKALDHAHRRHDEQGRPLGIVHRDISPQNILLSWDGDVKVTDFGIAKAAATLDPSDDDGLHAPRASGKLGFMSPEQARSERLDARSDLFSLGVVLYEMLSGAHPFRASTEQETRRRLLAGEHPPLALSRADVPEALAGLVAKLLAPDADQRPESAAAVSEALLALSYSSGLRASQADLATALAPLQGPSAATEADAEPLARLDRPAADEATPVEIPHPSTRPPPSVRPAPAGERREVTMLVAQMSGEGVPERSRERVRQSLERHGAWIEAAEERELVVLFGLGDTDGRDAEAAVRAGLVIVRRRAGDAPPSVGVHSGPIRVDDGGLPIADGRLAAMLATTQGLARAAGSRVAVSPLTARLVRRSFATEPFDDSARAVSGGGALVVGAITRDDTHKRFVGRHTELRQLGALLANATRRSAKLLVLHGATGVGKSRLVGEAKRRLERGAFNVAMYLAHCPLNGSSVPWSGLKALLHVLCGTQENDTSRRIMEVEPRLRALGLQRDQTGAVLALLGARVPTKAAESRALLRAAFERMVVSLCRDRLHCFAWDDAHAIDPETLDAVRRVLRRRPTLRGVFLLAQRGEVPRRLAKEPGVDAIEVGPMSERDTELLIEALLDARAVPADLFDHVRTLAGGHPLFVEEVLRDMMDAGALTVQSGRVRAEPELHGGTPRTLRTLVADRVSRLAQRERRVLQAVAVLGEPAFTPVLASLLELPVPTVDRHVRGLIDNTLVERQGPTQVRFASPLFQEIVLDAMPAAKRQAMHRKAAAVYSETHLTTAGDTAERVAQHWVDAGERERSVDHFWRSAEEKADVGELEGALRNMLRGLELSDPEVRDVPTLCGWLRRAADAASQVRKAKGLARAVEPSMASIAARGEPAEQVRARLHLARAFGAVNLFEEAYAALDAAAAIALDDPELTRARLTAAIEIAGRQGRFAHAADSADALEALTPNDDDAARLSLLAMARAGSGDAARAAALMDRVDALGPPETPLEAVSRQKHRLLIAFNERNFDDAMAGAKTLSELASSAGLRYEAAAALHNLGDCHDRLGDRPRAYAAFTESLELTRILEHERLAALNRMHLAFLSGLRGDEDSDEALKRLIRFADGRGFLWDVLEGRLLLARLTAHRGEIEDAKRMLDEVAEMADAQGHKLIADDTKALLDSL